VQANDLNRIVSFHADDASVFPIEEPIAIGKKAIRENWAHMIGIRGLRLVWQITKVAVYRSGDLAYVQSAYQGSFEDTQGSLPSIEARRSRFGRNSRMALGRRL
jgi:ketosteroid isomerase-like protein